MPYWLSAGVAEELLDCTRIFVAETRGNFQSLVFQVVLGENVGHSLAPFLVRLVSGVLVLGEVRKAQELLREGFDDVDPTELLDTACAFDLLLLAVVKVWIVFEFIQSRHHLLIDGENFSFDLIACEIGMR